MSKIPSWIKCEGCSRRAKLGLPASLASQHVLNVAINEKTRKMFETVFGKKKAAKIRTTADIDACFRDVARRYPHLMPGYDKNAVRKHGLRYDPNSEADMRKLGSPYDVSRDPFPHEQITDDGRLNPERRIG